MAQPSRVDGETGGKNSDRSLRYALLYWLGGSLWILLSDRLLFGETGPLAIGSMLKGLGFVTVTSLLLWGMLRRNGRYLREAAVRAERNEATLQSLLEALQEGLAEVDGEGRLLRWNPAFAEQFLLEPGERPDVGRLFGEEAARAMAGLLDGSDLRSVRFDVLAERGDRIILYQVAASPLRRPAVGRAVVVTSDLSERTRAERLLQEANERLERLARSRTAALEATNRELAAFAATVAHDLRSPIRAMAGYASMVLEDAGETLDEESRENLRRIQASAERLNHMVESLLRMARSTDRQLRIEPVDLAVQARRIAGEIAAQEPGRSVDFEIQDRMVVEADAAMLESVLQNLLSNAWKFTRGKPDARIAVRLEELPEGWVLRVEDNGVGFDRTRADELFSPFRRLHDAREYPGEGIGLATVARIAHRHGGRVGAEGEPGRGASFWLMLPRRAPDCAA
ncbi:MAG: ATP-binding protein [Fimbriimonadales bacterium]|nr:ATP-binding protein [Fimbriimonadales bacterium]